MKYRRFGKTDWQVSEIGHGMWGMAGWTGSDDDESLASLQKAIDLGCNFFEHLEGICCHPLARIIEEQAGAFAGKRRQAPSIIKQMLQVHGGLLHS